MKDTLNKYDGITGTNIESLAWSFAMQQVFYHAKTKFVMQEFNRPLNALYFVQVNQSFFGLLQVVVTFQIHVNTRNLLMQN